MRDRTAQTEPLTTGQQLVARWEGPSSGWSEPADLAEAIDGAIDAATLAERERCARLLDDKALQLRRKGDFGLESVVWHLASMLRRGPNVDQLPLPITEEST